MGKTHLSDLWPRLGCLRPVLEVDTKEADPYARAHAFLADEAEALARAYRGHGDQLAALQAEAAAEHHRAEARRPRQTRAVWPPLGRMRKA